MNEESGYNDHLSSASEEQDVMTLIKRIQQQLGFLEKKIDLLISKTEATSAGDRHFLKPSRPFDRHQHFFERGGEGRSGKKRFSRGHHFEKRRGGEGQGFGRKEKEDENFQNGDSSKERHFRKQHDGERGGFNQKKKPFFYKQGKGHR